MSRIHDASTCPGDARRPLPEPDASGQVLLRKASETKCHQDGEPARPKRLPAGNDRMLTQGRGCIARSMSATPARQ
eukprot:9479062-Pyramimonas_sp.AAC.2